MNATTPPVEILLRAFRYAYRTPLLVLHVCIGLPLILIGIVLGRGGWLTQASVRQWMGGLAWVCGLRVRGAGRPLAGGTLFVANHVSWLDIVVLHSQHMMGFIAKAEIRGWPLIGWLAAQGESIFLERGNGDSLSQVMGVAVQRLREGRAVGAFPEGGTRNGVALGNFHARIFAVAVEAAAPVQPVAICFGNGASAQASVAFAPRERFVGNFFRMLGEPVRPVQVHFLEPIPPGSCGSRREIAENAQAQVAQAMTKA